MFTLSLIKIEPGTNLVQALILPILHPTLIHESSVQSYSIQVDDRTDQDVNSGIEDEELSHSSLPADRTGSTGVAPLAPAARGCELPLLEFLSQALFSAIFPAFSAFVGPSLSFLRKVSLNSSEFKCSLLASYVEPTVPSA